MRPRTGPRLTRPRFSRSRISRPRLSTLALVVLFAVWVIAFRPTGLGGPATYIVVSGTSMEPTLHDGDLVVLRTADRYRTGDLVTYRIPAHDTGAGQLIIHRITGGTSTRGYVTQGDNRDQPDDWRPTDDDILGTHWFTVPVAGATLGLLRSPVVFPAVAGGLTVLLLLLRSPGHRRPEPADA